MPTYTHKNTVECVLSGIVLMWVYAEKRVPYISKHAFIYGKLDKYIYALLIKQNIFLLFIKYLQVI
jgi:hypothetical protein